MNEDQKKDRKENSAFIRGQKRAGLIMNSKIENGRNQQCSEGHWWTPSATVTRCPQCEVDEERQKSKPTFVTPDKVKNSRSSNVETDGYNAGYNGDKPTPPSDIEKSEYSVWKAGYSKGLKDRKERLSNSGVQRAQQSINEKLVNAGLQNAGYPKQYDWVDVKFTDGTIKKGEVQKVHSNGYTVSFKDGNDFVQPQAVIKIYNSTIPNTPTVSKDELFTMIGRGKCKLAGGYSPETFDQLDHNEIYVEYPDGHVQQVKIKNGINECTKEQLDSQVSRGIWIVTSKTGKSVTVKDARNGEIHNVNITNSQYPIQMGPRIKQMKTEGLSEKEIADKLSIPIHAVVLALKGAEKMSNRNEDKWGRKPGERLRPDATGDLKMDRVPLKRIDYKGFEIKEDSFGYFIRDNNMNKVAKNIKTIEEAKKLIDTWK